MANAVLTARRNSSVEATSTQPTAWGQTPAKPSVWTQKTKTKRFPKIVAYFAGDVLLSLIWAFVG